jgi:hypothetical protein
VPASRGSLWRRSKGFGSPIRRRSGSIASVSRGTDASTSSTLTAGVCGHWLIGWFAHNHGDVTREVRGAAVQGHNVPLVSLLTMGESWHNNHHAYPGSARLGIAKGEWDPGWWVLCGLRRAGLGWNVKEPHHLPLRPELMSPRGADATGKKGHTFVALRGV